MSHPRVRLPRQVDATPPTRHPRLDSGLSIAWIEAKTPTYARTDPPRATAIAQPRPRRGSDAVDSAHPRAALNNLQDQQNTPLLATVPRRPVGGRPSTL